MESFDHSPAGTHVPIAETATSVPPHRRTRTGSRPGLTEGVLRRVVAFIEANLGERISLEAMAREAGVSRFHFARQFRLSTGESPMAYLRRVRIEQSKCILREGRTTMAGVAARLGFADQSHFTRTFERLVGVAPRDFIGDAEARGSGRPALPRRASAGLG
jgi:AraC family transcriptional regulator